ncbi:hypothetical protein ACWKW6_30125 [Dyadobacter jiangsuensis]
MFTSSPWGAYFTILAPLLTAYYLFVGLRFYGRDLKARFSQKRNFDNRPANPSRQNFDVPDPPVDAFSAPALPAQANAPGPQQHAEDELAQPFSWQNEELSAQIQLPASYLREAIKDACEKNYGKQELILLLQMTLKEYPAMSQKRFRTAIDNLITAECSKYGAVHLHQKDLDELWSPQV